MKYTVLKSIVEENTGISLSRGEFRQVMFLENYLLENGGYKVDLAETVEISEGINADNLYVNKVPQRPDVE